MECCKEGVVVSTAYVDVRSIRERQNKMIWYKEQKQTRTKIIPAQTNSTSYKNTIPSHAHTTRAHRRAAGEEQLQGQRLALKGGHIFGLEGANERMHGMCIPAGSILQVHSANAGANSPGA